MSVDEWEEVFTDPTSGTALQMLLWHVLDASVPMSPALVVVKHPEWGTYGVALVIDGWYSKADAVDVMENGSWVDLLELAKRDAVGQWEALAQARHDRS